MPSKGRIISTAEALLFIVSLTACLFYVSTTYHATGIAAVLTRARQAVSVGMTKEDVLRRLGSPDNPVQEAPLPAGEPGAQLEWRGSIVGYMPLGFKYPYYLQYAIRIGPDGFVKGLAITGSDDLSEYD